MLLRIRKRNTSSEGTADEFCDTEFQDEDSGGLDHRPSVYRIEDPSLVQCFTEHTAACSLDPKSRKNLDVEGLEGADAVPKPLPPPWPFALSAAAHCEISCASDADVRALARQLFDNLTPRTKPVTMAEVRGYVRAAVERGDAEWTTYLARGDIKPSWKAAAGQ